MGRQYAVIALICGAFLLIVLRLFYWQIIKGAALAQAAAEQYYFTLKLTPQRGSILASDGQALVANRGGYFAYAEPKKIAAKHDFALRVAPLINLDPAVIEERITKENIVWAPLKHKISSEIQQKITDAHLNGVGFEKEGARFYPEASIAANLLGFVGSDENGDDKGYFGLEGFYNLALEGKPGSLLQEKDAGGLPILLGTVKRIEAEDGQSLELYLDRTVQTIVEEKLKAGLVKYGAREGLVAVMDPKTGGILASAAFPSYDPNHFGDFDQLLYPNPLIAKAYEPGSTFKTMVMAAALNERLVDPKTVFNEDGPVKVGDYTIRTWNNQYHGEMTATQILEKSSNPGMVFVGKKLGKDKLLRYIKAFGFGEETGIDLEEEEASPLRADDTWKEIDLATASFGQGIAVTPIQMLSGVAAIANGGKLMQPHLVSKLQDATHDTVVDIKPKIIREVIRPGTAKVMTDMMISAVDNGEAKWAKPPGYRIAGKTGTAQIPVAGHYDDKKTIASFVGFAPADDPKFAILVLLREPTSSPWGSETAAPLFFSIAKELFNYYGISPLN